MSTSLLRYSALALAIGLAAALSSGCVVGGYGYDGNVGVGYYEPFDADYGGWGPGYQVGPYRDGGDHRGGRQGDAHAYRSAPVSRSMPSIPSGGGGHAGGGGGRGRR
jgi:hypothetical protein